MQLPRFDSNPVRLYADIQASHARELEVAASPGILVEDYRTADRSVAAPDSK